MSNRKVIAVTGKGGTGKTALVAIMTKLITSKFGNRVLVIDADSAISLPQTLGITVDKAISDIREEVITDPEAKKKVEQTHISNIIKPIIKHQFGIDLLIMGRPEGAGCFCTVNDLLKYGIETITEGYDIIIIDCEAGPEQINRRVLESVNTLVIVADTSARSLKTAGSIYQIARSGAIKGNWDVGLVINRTEDTSCKEAAHQALRYIDTKVLGCIPNDQNITRYDAGGKSLLDLPENSPSVLAVEKIIREIGLSS